MIKAVAHCRHILTPAFVKDLDLAIRNRTKLSSLKKYVPPADPTLQTAKFYPIPARKTLFEPLQFVFMSVGEKKESEQLVKDLGGTVALLDPLCPKRRNVILSEESIVMDTKDLAVSEYVKTTLLERGLVPTSPNDLILSLLYNDKAKLFKRSSDTQSTQSAQIRVQDTQNFSQMTCTVQDTQPVSNRSCDESTIEASAVPPRLDRTIHSPLKSVQKNSIKVESCASTVKPEMLSEPDEVSRNGAKKAVSSPDLSLSKTRQDISFCEASAVPPKLDKTIKTPLASPFSTKQEVTFIEPSAVPPKLDKTIKSPVSSIVASTEKISNTSAIEPSHFVSPLGQNPLFNKSAALVSPGASSETNRRIDVTTPTRTSIGSDVSLFDNSRSTSFVGISTPSGSVTSKPPLMNSGKSASSSRKKRPFSLESSDSDEDSGDDNPFAKSKTKSTFFTVSSASKNSKSLASHNVSKKPKMDASNNSADNFMCRESESEGKSASDSGTADPESSGRVCESPSSSPRVSSNQLQTSDNQFVGNEEIPSSASQTQSVKRELHEKTESATKKLKTVDNSVSIITTTLSNITIPDTSHSVWIKRPDTNAELERSFSSYVVTDISADLIKESRDSSETHLESVEGCAQSVVNFKRFKKKGVITRSMDVTLTNGQFRSNATSIFDASQSQQVSLPSISTCTETLKVA